MAGSANGAEREEGARKAMAAGAATSEDLVEALRALLVEVSEGRLQPEEVDPSANLFDFGYVDSLSGVMFLARIEEEWGVHIEDFDLVDRLHTLEAIASHVRENR
jgi:acyl carrier protein